MTISSAIIKVMHMFGLDTDHKEDVMREHEKLREEIRRLEMQIRSGWNDLDQEDKVKRGRENH